MKEIDESSARLRAASYCSTAERCRSEVRRKLEEWNAPPAAFDRILNYLESENYLNEARFCRAFSHDKLRYSGWGRIKISQALRLKEIDASLIKDALAELDDEEYTATLKKLIAAKNRTLRAASDYERNGKLIRFAAGRGFEPSLICRLLHTSEDDY